MARQLATWTWVLCNLMTMVAGLQLLPPMPAENAIALVLGLTFCSTLIHELGHAAAAVKLGAAILVFAVWGIAYSFTEKRLSTKGGRGHEIAGYVRYASPAGQKLSLREHAFIAAAGPTANLLTAIPALACDQFHTSSIPQGVLTIFAILSAGMAAANLIPFSGSDGFILRQYLRRTS